MQQTGIKGIVVNNPKKKFLKEKQGTTCAKLKRAKTKRGGFGVKSPTQEAH